MRPYFFVPGSRRERFSAHSELLLRSKSALQFAPMISLRRFAGLLGAGAVGICVGALVTAAHAGPTRETPYDVVRQLARVLVQVESLYVDPVERPKLLRGAVKGMVQELDPHSAYLSPEDWSEFKNDTQGKFAGVGIEVDLKGDVITVIAPIEGSPADRAGVRSGDRILAIDGEPVVEASPDKAIKKMRGPAGTRVKLTVRRPNVQAALTFELVREVVTVASVRSKLLVQNVGFIRIQQFREGTHAHLLRTIASLRAAAKGELAGMILDLRTNPGGLVDEAVEIADEFLDKGGIYSTRHRGMLIDDVSARSGGALATVPMVVLVNDWSASASELLAGALQDNRRALIVGSQTFGKGSVQSIIELPDGAGMKLTIARYYTPSGRAIQAEGIQPDVLIASKLNEPDGIGPFREKNYENHLPSEQGGRVPARFDGGVITAPEDGGSLEPTDVRSMPADPRGGPDYGLEVAFDVLTKQLVGRGPTIAR